MSDTMVTAIAKMDDDELLDEIEFGERLGHPHLGTDYDEALMAELDRRTTP